MPSIPQKSYLQVQSSSSHPKNRVGVIAEPEFIFFFNLLRAESAFFVRLARTNGSDVV
jgi:hypothetical protein